MILFLSSFGNNLDSSPNPRFGRAEFYIKYNLGDNTWEAFENPAISKSGGAGIAAAQFLVDNEADIAISGRFGPNAFRALKSAKIKMLTFEDSYKSIKDVIQAYKNNSLEEA